MYYIYIIYSKSSDRYYIGYSNDPERRLEEHNTKPFNTYTSKHRPWAMKAAFPVSEDRGKAMKIERYLKKLKSRKVQYPFFT
jgi:putative endonuclease